MSKFIINTIMCAICMYAGCAYGTVLVSENFNSLADSYGTYGQTAVSDDWDWIVQDAGAVSATLSEATHYGAEISSPGRGGSGKSLKAWRHSTFHGEYGGLYSLNKWPVGYDHVFIRYYILIPAAMDSSQYFKGFRINYGASGEIYQGFFFPAATGYMAILAGGAWTTVLSGADFQAIRDGNWHYLQWEFDLGDANTLRLWVDGVSKYDGTYEYSSTGTFIGMQHLPVGNTLDHTGQWQESWQAMEIDDFIVATTSAEVAVDTTGPTVTISQADPTTVQAATTTLTGTSSDASGVSSCKWRPDAAPDGSNGTACSGSTSWSCNVTGLSVGANTIYVGCVDPSSNWGSDSLTVNREAAVVAGRVVGGTISGGVMQ